MAEAVQVPTPPYPPFPAMVPPAILAESGYRLRFAAHASELDEVLRLRFAVFNRELGEGLDASWTTGRDEDEFDRHCHHMVVEHTASGAIIGTYRLQTAEMASAGAGFYTATEFDLGPLHAGVLPGAVELGRACIAAEHRHTRVLFLLFKGLASYLAHNRKRFLFGCCSLTSQDAALGAAALEHLEERELVSRELVVPALPEFACRLPEVVTPSVPEAVILPPLFEIYLRLGGRVCSPPAIDRRFKTIDFLVLFDLDAMDRASLRRFMP